MEHLLGRLEVEQSAPVIRRIVKLLMNSFHPANKESDDLVRATLMADQVNGRAWTIHFINSEPDFHPYPSDSLKNVWEIPFP